MNDFKYKYIQFMLLVLFFVVMAGIVIPEKIFAYDMPILGVNFGHLTKDIPNDICENHLDNIGIIYTYHQPGVRQIVQNTLKQMHENGVNSLRLLLWHETDIGGNVWGEIPSAGGKLSEPYKTNFIQYLTDVKTAGYTTFTLSFAPVHSNNPLEDYGNPTSHYDSTRFDENWQFIQDVRAIAKQYGPGTIHFDLQNEGAPYDSLGTRIINQTIDYHTRMYQRYVDAYGANDVTIGFVPGKYTSGALENLIKIFSDSGRPFPKWFHLSLYDDPTPTKEGILQTLNDVETVLKQHNLTQPLVIGESYYNSSIAANAIKEYMQSSNRPIWEILEWSRNENGSCPAIPYSVSNYLTVFPQPTHLNGSCSGTTATISWNPVPGATSYAIRVNDYANSWSGTCETLNPGDICSNVNTNSYSFTAISGHTYSWWVHSINDAGWSPAIVGLNFSCKPGDLNSDGSVNISDYNLLVAGFGHPYTIYDYNILVENFGK